MVHINPALSGLTLVAVTWKVSPSRSRVYPLNETQPLGRPVASTKSALTGSVAVTSMATLSTGAGSSTIGSVGAGWSVGVGDGVEVGIAVGVGSSCAVGV